MSQRSSENVPEADQAGPSRLQEPEAEDKPGPFNYVPDKRLAGKWNEAQKDYYLEPRVRDKKRSLIYQKVKQFIFFIFLPQPIDDVLTKDDWIEIFTKHQPKVMMNRVNLIVKHEQSWAKLVAKKHTFDELPPEEKYKCYAHMMKVGARTAEKLDFTLLNQEREYNLEKSTEDYIIYRHFMREEAELIRLGVTKDVESPADTSEAQMNANQSNASEMSEDNTDNQQLQIDENEGDDIREEEDDPIDELNNNQIQMHEEIPNVSNRSKRHGRYAFDSESTEPSQSENYENGSENLPDNTDCNKPYQIEKHVGELYHLAKKQMKNKISGKSVEEMFTNIDLDSDSNTDDSEDYEGFSNAKTSTQN